MTDRETELLDLRARVRELTADLHRSLHYLATVREHLDSLFASRRWRIGSLIGDSYLRLRGQPRPPTAEDHLRDIFREIDAWEARRRSQPVEAVLGPRTPLTTESALGHVPLANLPTIDRREGLFYQYVEQLLLTSADRLFERSFDRSESVLSAVEVPQDSSGGPLVSVIMPSYNRGHVVDEAIRSVLEQTYSNWELIVADDGSTDGTRKLLEGLEDPRIRYLWQEENRGAAAARNRALAESGGDLIAYLDSDNLWHPGYLSAMVDQLQRHTGHQCVYCRHIDVVVEERGLKLKRFRAKPFDYEALTEKNFVDLNSFVHRRALYEVLGGFDERLRRQQDWDLILKYAFLRDPLFFDGLLVLYRRNPEWDQITILEHDNLETIELIQEKQAKRYESGLTVGVQTPRPSVSVISWDICRNHFSKAFNLAEALALDREVELIGFRFFDEEIFPPYAGETPSFETKYFSGGDFPSFHREYAQALSSIRGDVVYAVKPRLPSLGLALLANFHFGKPVVLEINDLESEVSNPKAGGQRPPLSVEELDAADPRLISPYHDVWSRLLEGLAAEVPLLVTHNANLDRRFGNRSFQVRNLKDERRYDPALYSRNEIRGNLGFGPDDRVLLFGGMVRRHKGVFSLAEFVEALDDERYKLLVVSSRTTPDATTLERAGGDRIHFLPPQGRNDMAGFNLAADLTVLWLDPEVPASHFQMPFKLTDAMAMGLPVIANPVSDLTGLGQAGYLRLVEYGDFEGLGHVIEEIFSDPEATGEMLSRARRLYLRQFGYHAARANLEILLRRHAQDEQCLRVARRFEAFFSDFYRASHG